jgi:hypothetical protein
VRVLRKEHGVSYFVLSVVKFAEVNKFIGPKSLTAKLYVRLPAFADSNIDITPTFTHHTLEGVTSVAVLER